MVSSIFPYAEESWTVFPKLEETLFKSREMYTEKRTKAIAKMRRTKIKLSLLLNETISLE